VLYEFKIKKRWDNVLKPIIIIMQISRLPIGVVYEKERFQNVLFVEDRDAFVISDMTT